MRATLIILLLVLGYAALVIVSHRSAEPYDHALTAVGAATKEAQARLTILDWNLGYAGLGVESEFVDHPPGRAGAGRGAVPPR